MPDSISCRAAYLASACSFALTVAAGMPVAVAQTVINNQTVTVPPGTIPAGTNLTVGSTGTGVLNIVAGGVVTTGDTTIGSLAGSDGTISVSGAGASFSHINTMRIGDLGTGRFLISNGATVSSEGVHLGDGGGSGTATVSGVGSSWNFNNSLYIGYDNNSTATVNVLNGATLNLGSQNLYISYDNAAGTLNVSGGSTVISGDVSFGYYSETGQGKANISGAGTTWTVNGDMTIGDEGGSGELNIRDGAVVSVSDRLRMGGYDDYITRGDLLITGPGSRLTVGGDAEIGYERPAIVIISNGGLFQVLGSTSISEDSTAPSSVTVTGQGSRFESENNTVYIGNYGEGSLNVLNGATASLNSTYVGYNPDAVGNITVDNGTLSVTSGNTLAIGYDGTGTATLANGGKITTTEQVYIAQLNGSFGTLNIGAGALDPAAAPGTLEAPSLRFGNGNGLINFNLLGSTTFTPELIGHGNINVIAGTTTFVTDSGSYTGAVDVTGGKAVFNALLPGDVTVSGTGVVGGTGTINSLDVQSGGTVAPGNSPGTITVLGTTTFATGSNYNVEIAGSVSDLILTHDAVLNGGTVHASGAPSLLRYTILTSTNAWSGLGFAGVDTTSAFIHYSLDYDPNNVYLVVDGVDSIVPAARTPNQIAVAGALDQFSHSNPLFAAVAGSSLANIEQVLDALSGEIHASVGGALADDNRYVREAITGRLVQAYHGGARGDGSQSIVMSSAAQQDVVEINGSTRMSLGAGSDDAREAAPSSGRRLAFWSHAIGAWGKYDTNNNAATTDRDLGGIISGVDTTIGGGWRAGFTVGYVNSQLGVDDRLSNAKVDSYVVGAYAGGDLGYGFALRSGGTWSWNDIKTDRLVSFPGFSEFERANYNGNTGQIFAELAYPILSRGVLLEPFAGLAYVHVGTDGFTESGPLAGLASGGMDMDVGYGTLGARVGTTWTLGSTTVLPHASIAWQYAFGDTSPSIALQFASTGIGMNIQGVPLADSSALLEIGADFVIGRDATLGLSYVGQYSTDFNDNGVRGRLNWKF